MKLWENVNTIVSIFAGLLSIIMFFLTKREKDKCVEIKNRIEENVNILNKNSSIKSKDTFDINKIDTFDNRKSIK